MTDVENDSHRCGRLGRILRQEGRAIVASILYFSRFPIPMAPLMDDDDWRRAMSWWPLVGIGVGLAAAGVWWLAAVVLGLPGGVAAGLVVATGIIATGALQEDGFADVCDGFGGGASRDEVLTIMRDSRVGAYGVVGLIMLIGMKWQALAALPTEVVVPSLVAAHAASRAWAASVLAVLAYARTDKSRGRYVSSQLKGVRLAIPVAIGAISLLLILPVGLGLACLAAGTMAWGVCLAWFHRRLGGYTGDCLGTTQQMCELTLFLTLLGMT